VPTATAFAGRLPFVDGSGEEGQLSVTGDAVWWLEWGYCSV